MAQVWVFPIPTVAVPPSACGSDPRSLQKPYSSGTDAVLILPIPLRMIARCEQKNKNPFEGKMIITKVRTVALDAAFPQNFAYLRSWYGKDVTLIAEIETDKGLVGRG